MQQSHTQSHTYTAPSGPTLVIVTEGDCRLPDSSVDTSIITPFSKYLTVHGLTIYQRLKKSINKMKTNLRILFLNNITR